MEILRQNVGIDVAKESFVATFTILLAGHQVKHTSTKKFENNLKGFEELLQWVSKLKDDHIPVLHHGSHRRLL